MVDFVLRLVSLISRRQSTGHLILKVNAILKRKMQIQLAFVGIGSRY